MRKLMALSTKKILKPKSVDLNYIVESLDKLLNRLMGADIQMRTACSPDIGTVKADPAQIEQDIMNLVVNARDAMPTGGCLTNEDDNHGLHTNYTPDHASLQPG